MFFNFIKVTLRNIAAHKTYSAINIFGLAIGMACALIITLYIKHESGFDRFHSEYPSIFRVTLNGQLRGVQFNGATTSAKMASFIQPEIEGVEAVTRIARLGAWLIANDSIRYNEDDLLFVDSNFFTIFNGFEIIEGDINTFLRKPRSIVLTESSAIKYFGSANNLLGKTLKVEAKDKPYTITGIIKDSPANSHIGFDMLASFSTYEKLLSYSWISNNVYTYIKIGEEVMPDTILADINNFYSKYIRAELVSAVEDIFQSSDVYRFDLQPLSRIHLHSSLEAELQPNGNAIYVYGLGIVAILILLIACLNFMNLSTANSVSRSYEVSVRKVTGADKRFLIVQFLIESIVISLIALAFALLLAELLLPYFNRFLNLSLEFGFFQNIRVVLLILVLTLGVGILAGSYPAYFISTFDPVEVLAGKHYYGLKNSKIRSIFVILQFTISIFIIILTLVIYAQMNFMMKKDLGFDSDQLLVVRRSDALKENINSFKEEIEKSKDVIVSTNSNSIPGRQFHLNTFKLEGKQEDAALLFNQIFVNYDFSETFSFKLDQGRFFDSSVSSDSFACVLNQSAAKLMGLSYPVGAELIQPSIKEGKSRKYHVVGVVEDFHFQSLDQQIGPLVICLMHGNWEGYINIKIAPNNTLKTISSIEKAWYKYAPDYPFVHFFLNDDFNRNYAMLILLGRVFIVFSILSIFVACLGLYGLIAHATNQRTREMGIRKSHGASLFQLVMLMSGETIKLLLISTLIAWFAAYFAIQYWMQSFFYTIQFNPLYYIIAVLIVLVIVFPTVLSHTLRAGKKEPGLTLKYD